MLDHVYASLVSAAADGSVTALLMLGDYCEDQGNDECYVWRAIAQGEWFAPVWSGDWYGSGSGSGYWYGYGSGYGSGYWYGYGSGYWYGYG